MRSLFKIVWICTLFSLFATFCLAGEAPQQTNASTSPPEKLRVLITDCKNGTPQNAPDLGSAVTSALYYALGSFSKQPFDVISWQEVWVAAERLGLPLPEATAPAGQWTEEDRYRLGTALHADLLCEAQAGISRDRKNAKLSAVTIVLFMRDMALRIPRAGGYVTISGKAIPIAIRQGVEFAGKECADSFHSPMHVLEHTEGLVNVDFGVRNGAKVGDECVIVREVAGKKMVVGRIKIRSCHPADSEGDILKETSEIRAGDTALVSYARPDCDGFP